MFFPSDSSYPRDLPAWLISGHLLESVSITDDAPMERGEDLARQVYTWAPQIASVSTLLEQHEFDRLVSWYESEVKAGSRMFDVRVAGEGNGEEGEEVLVWWSAQQVAPFQWETLHSNPATGENRYRVTWQLLLLDGPHETRTDPSPRALLRSRFTLTARPDLPVLRARLSAQFTLTALVVERERVAEDGDERITEDGETRLLET